MTVKELIEELEQYPGNYVVFDYDTKMEIVDTRCNDNEKEVYIKQL